MVAVEAAVVDLLVDVEVAPAVAAEVVAVDTLPAHLPADAEVAPAEVMPLVDLAAALKPLP